MLENILALLAALIVIFFASILVRKQNQCHNIYEELREEVDNAIDNAIDEYGILTNEELDEHTLTHLESALDKFNIRLNSVEAHLSPHLERRKRSGKYKKNATDDGSTI